MAYHLHTEGKAEDPKLSLVGTPQDNLSGEEYSLPKFTMKDLLVKPSYRGVRNTEIVHFVQENAMANSVKSFL